MRILLIEDNQGDERLIREMLAQAPDKIIHLECVSRLSEGVKRLSEGKIEGILLDLLLPDSQGIDTLKTLQKVALYLPIIVLTGAKDESLAIKALQEGAEDYLLKDQIDFQLLFRTLRYAAERKQAQMTLQESENKYRTLYDSSQDAIMVLSSQKKFINGNPATLKLFGCKTEQEFNSKTPADLSPKYQPDRSLSTFKAEQMIELAIKNGSHFFEWRHKKVNGEEFDATVLLTKMQLKGEELVQATVRDITNRKALEREILDISNRERRKIGQDLHDDLGQSLTGISLLFKVLQEDLSAKILPETKQVNKISKLLNQAINQTRSLAKGLTPIAVEEHGFRNALQTLADGVNKASHIVCLFSCSPHINLRGFDSERATHLYRIVQEAVNNSLKHSDAKEITISLKLTGKKMVLEAKDDGCGFSKKTNTETGMGLKIMQYRAAIIHARLIIESGDRGTCVCCVLDTYLSLGGSKQVKRSMPNAKEIS